jgi:hypothetical protein
VEGGQNDAVDGGNGGKDERSRQASISKPFCLASEQTGRHQDVISGMLSVLHFAKLVVPGNQQYSGADAVLSAQRPAANHRLKLLKRVCGVGDGPADESICGGKDERKRRHQYQGWHKLPLNIGQQNEDKQLRIQDKRVYERESSVFAKR